MSKYYIVIEGSQQGPFSLEELSEKKITKNTLVWAEKMDNWVEAVNLEELKDLIKTIPPPIPTKAEKPIKVEAQISKKKEKLISPQTEVVIAKETKSVFLQIIYGLIIGAVSFPIFYFVVYQTNKYDNYNAYNEALRNGNAMNGINISDFPFTWTDLNYSDIQRNIEIRQDFSTVQNNIERRKEIFTEKSTSCAFITFFIASCVLVVFRYVFKGVKWVQKTSNKDI